METDFSDGVRLILLTGCLEVRSTGFIFEVLFFCLSSIGFCSLSQGYFVPLYLYNQKPTTTEEKMENMNYAFRSE